MGKKDIVQKLYTEDNRIFADIVNYMLYEGQSVIREQDLTEVNGEELFLQEAGTKQSYATEQRYRDVMKRVILRQGPDAMYLLISLENQSEVHYAMPVRNMLNDALRYVRQIETIHRSYQIRREQKSPSKPIFIVKQNFYQA